MYSMKFHYDKRGYGNLQLLKDGELYKSWSNCRTGSIDSSGRLVNAIEPGIWVGKAEPVDTTEIAMVVDGIGWKYRLWLNGRWTHYLIHPDGNLPGSMGCIVRGCIWVDLRDLLKQIHLIQMEIELEVTKDE